MRRTHVTGKQAVHIEIGMMLMIMNLTKLAIEAFQPKSIKNKKYDETIKVMIISSWFFYLELVISHPLIYNHGR